MFKQFLKASLGIFLLILGASNSNASDASLEAANWCGEHPKFVALTLKDALASAYTGQPLVISARQDVEKAKANVLTATTPFLPSAMASLQGEHFVSRIPGGAVSVIGSSVVGGQGERYSAYPSVGLNWNIFNGGKDIAGYRGAQAGVRASENDLANQLNDTLGSVLTAYNDLMKAQSAVQQQTATIVLLQQTLQRSEQRYRQGRGNLIAVSQARVTLFQNERELFQGCQTLFDKSGALAQAIGIRLPADALLALSDPMPDAAFLQVHADNLDESIQTDPRVQSAKEREDMAQKKLEQARAAFYPTVALFGRYDWLGQSSNSLGDAYQSTGANSYHVGIALQQTLGPLTSEYAAVQSAQADFLKAQAAYQQAVIDVETKLRGALSAKASADLAAGSAEASAGHAAYAVRLSEQLFSKGMSDLDAVAQATLSAEKEKEAAYETALDARLATWLAWRALRPMEFAPALMRESHAEQMADGPAPVPTSRPLGTVAQEAREETAGSQTLIQMNDTAIATAAQIRR